MPIDVNWPETNWILEAARILIPGLITVIVGLWITRSNERLKSELLVKTTKFQLNHPKRAEAAAELAPLLTAVAKGITNVTGRLEALVTAKTTLEQCKEPVEQLRLSIKALSEAWDKYEVLFDASLRSRFLEVVLLSHLVIPDLWSMGRRTEKSLTPQYEAASRYGERAQRIIGEIQGQFRSLLAD